MPVRGTEIVAGNIVLYGKGFVKTVNATMDILKLLIDKRLTANISLKDHSLAELAALGHPYSIKHGSISIHQPPYQVHTQSGKMLKAKFAGTTKANIERGELKAAAYAGIDEEKAPHALHVMLGTSRMLPRPYLEGTKQEVAQQCFETVKVQLKNLTFNFRPVLK